MDNIKWLSSLVELKQCCNHSFLEILSSVDTWIRGSDFGIQGRTELKSFSGTHNVTMFAFRSTSTASELSLPGKITSLDHNPGEV